METVKASGVKVYWEHTVVDVALSRTGFVQNVDIKAKNPQPSDDAAPPAEDAGEEQEDRTESGGRRIPCIAVLCCNFKQCDRDVFAAVNDSGLVFDGGLVVDSVSACSPFVFSHLLVMSNTLQSFGTVDPSIFAVGDFTRFSRMYKDALPHVR